MGKGKGGLYSWPGARTKEKGLGNKLTGTAGLCRRRAAVINVTVVQNATALVLLVILHDFSISKMHISWVPWHTLAAAVCCWCHHPAFDSNKAVIILLGCTRQTAVTSQRTQCSRPTAKTIERQGQGCFFLVGLDGAHESSWSLLLRMGTSASIWRTTSNNFSPVPLSWSPRPEDATDPEVIVCGCPYVRSRTAPEMQLAVRSVTERGHVAGWKADRRSCGSGSLRGGEKFRPKTHRSGLCPGPAGEPNTCQQDQQGGFVRRASNDHLDGWVLAC